MLNERQREERKKYIGSSDAQVVLGLDPWGRSRADLVLEKTGRLVEQKTDNDAMLAGQLMEPVIMGLLEQKIGQRIERDRFFIHTNQMMAANLDGIILDGEQPIIVEAKSVGLIADPKYLYEFGDEGSDEVPAHVLAQCHHQLAVVRQQKGLEQTAIVLVPTFIVRRGFCLFRITFNQDMVDFIQSEEVDFFERYIKTGQLPEDDPPTLRTLKRIKRIPDKLIELDQEILATYQRWKRAVKASRNLTKIADQLKADIINALGDTEAGIVPSGEIINFAEYKRRGYEVKPTTYRRLKLIPPKNLVEKKG